MWIIGYYFPSSVIKGMLTGIGIIIILKQIPHFFGIDKDPEGNFVLFGLVNKIYCHQYPYTEKKQDSVEMFQQWFESYKIIWKNGVCKG